MAVRDARSQRLFVKERLVGNTVIETTREQANYLVNVLRLKEGDIIHVFNGSDGEWACKVEIPGRKKCRLIVDRQTRPQPAEPVLHFLFAPLKQGRLDYMVEKAVEMGVSHLQPVITQHTQVRAVNDKRFRAIATEAAEQCGRLSVPDLFEPVSLDRLSVQYGEGHAIVFCDEKADHQNNFLGLQRFADGRTLALLVGPEGGFSEDERALLLKLPNVTRLWLGPRTLRADTAAVAALALLQSAAGDWHNGS